MTIGLLCGTALSSGREKGGHGRGKGGKEDPYRGTQMTELVPHDADCQQCSFCTGKGEVPEKPWCRCSCCRGKTGKECKHCRGTGTKLVGSPEKRSTSGSTTPTSAGGDMEPTEHRWTYAHGNTLRGKGLPKSLSASYTSTVGDDNATRPSMVSNRSNGSRKSNKSMASGISCFAATREYDQRKRAESMANRMALVNVRHDPHGPVTASDTSDAEYTTEDADPNAQHARGSTRRRMINKHSNTRMMMIVLTIMLAIIGLVHHRAVKQQTRGPLLPMYN